MQSKPSPDNCLTTYEIGDGEYLYRPELVNRLHEEMHKLAQSKDEEAFKRGYGQALDMALNWVYSGPKKSVEEGRD